MRVQLKYEYSLREVETQLSKEYNYLTVTCGVQTDNNKYNYCTFFPLELVLAGLVRKVFVLTLAATVTTHNSLISFWIFWIFWMA